MRLLAILLAFSMNTTGFAQEPAQESSQASAPTAPAPVPQEKQTVIIPAGTRVPVTLTNTISTTSTKAGDLVRVVTAFPVTIETQLAIPAGSYIEGVVDKISKRKSANQNALWMHFTRIVFANGYQVSLEGATAEAQRMEAEKNSGQVAALPRQKFPGVMGFQQGPVQPPALTPPSRPGPNPAIFGGIAAAIGVTLILTGVLMRSHRGFDVTYDTGTQFDLVFQKSVALDVNRIAMSKPNAQ